MKLEVGMYVRHKPLLSSTYIKINKIKEIEEKENCLHVWLENKDLITEKYIIKASHNIIDLIEVGDYVNGYKVIDIVENDIYISNFYAEQCIDNVTIKNIKSIVTKEMFANAEYKVETN